MLSFDGDLRMPLRAEKLEWALAPIDSDLPSSESMYSSHKPALFQTLPQVMCEAVREVETATGAPGSLVVGSALGTLSVAAQALARVIRPSHKFPTPLGLFVLVVAKSGEGKSTVDALFTHDLRELEREWSDADAASSGDAEARLIVWQERCKGLKAAIRRCASEPEKISLLQEQLQDLLQKRPPEANRSRLFYDDVSLRALIEGMQFWPAAGIVSAEGARHLKGPTMRDLEDLCSLWGGEPLKMERSKLPTLEAALTTLTISLMVQPEAFQEFCRARGELARSSGFLARSLITMPAPTESSRLYTNSGSTWPALNAYQERLIALAREAHAVLSGEKPQQLLTMSPSAEKLFQDSVATIEQQRSVTSKYYEIQDWISRAGEHIARIAGLFHLLEGGGSQINERCMRLAIDCGSFYLGEFNRLFGKSGHLTEDYANADFLANWIRRRMIQENLPRVTWTIRELRQSGPPRMRPKSTGVLDNAIDFLCRQGALSSMALSNGTLFFYLSDAPIFLVLNEKTDREQKIQTKRFPVQGGGGYL